MTFLRALFIRHEPPAALEERARQKKERAQAMGGPKERFTAKQLTKSAHRRRERFRGKHPDRPEPKEKQGGAQAGQRRFQRRVQERREKRRDARVAKHASKAAAAAMAVSARIAAAAKAGAASDALS